MFQLPTALLFTRSLSLFISQICDRFHVAGVQHTVQEKAAHCVKWQLALGASVVGQCRWFIASSSCQRSLASCWTLSEQLLMLHDTGDGTDRAETTQILRTKLWHAHACAQSGVSDIAHQTLQRNSKIHRILALKLCLRVP